jgi:hypothetical protein
MMAEREGADKRALDDRLWPADASATAPTILVGGLGASRDAALRLLAGW